MVTARTWLRTGRFDLGLQLGALAGVAPALIIYAAYGATGLPVGVLIAVPFLHVFGSFFFAFSPRNQSPSPPRKLAARWAGWLALATAALWLAPRALATFALLYGGWHILRQNFGFLRELAARSGLAADRALRRLDLAAALAPAICVWLLVSDRGPWRFLGTDIHHLPIPPWLLALAFTAVPATAFLRERHIGRRANASAAGLLLLAGNAAALVAPALLVDDLTLIYTLSASFHGIQYLLYLAEREREASPEQHPTRVLAPLASAIVLCTMGWLAALLVASWLLPATLLNQAILIAWYAIVPFHYFVDGRIWKRRPRYI